MSRPRLLDLFCGQGGAGAGYALAGFEVVGVDIERQPRYPFRFYQGDALEVLRRMLADDPGWPRGEFAAVHASAPCQAYSDLQRRTGRSCPELIEPVRELLEELGLPFVIENVEGAPLRRPVRVCGAGLPGLRVIRHRLFESNVRLVGVPCPERHPLVFTHDRRKAHYGRLNQDESFVQVTGGGNCTVANKRAAMGVPWMTGRGANEAIPPAYTEHIGRYLMEAVRRG